MLIDSHCHLDKLDVSHYAGGMSELLLQTQADGITEILCVNVDTERFSDTLTLIANYDFVHASAGVHPLNIEASLNIDLLHQQAAHNKVIAVGETGLDYFYFYTQFPPTPLYSFARFLKKTFLFV